MEQCGHCKKFNPEWEKFVQGSKMKTQKINASSGNPMIKKMGVSGYPTVIIVEGDKKIDTFSGERTQTKSKQVRREKQELIIKN